VISGKESQVWLLEYETFSSRVQAQFAQGKFLPPLNEVWQQGTATRQFNWLWQIAQLWQPLQVQGVATTLINPGLVRVNSGIIQLQELEFDETEVALNDLGQFWSTFVSESQPETQSFLEQLCHRLIAGKLDSSERLVNHLEEGLATTARLQSRSYQIAVASDAGPSRSHNEDAYYQQQNPLPSRSHQTALAIVCDGVGGHYGGEVASNLVIQNLHQQLKKNLQEASNSRNLTEQIEKAVSSVNHLICQENDASHRRSQQRMGTTLVMAFAHNHEMYVTHVGDSRVYLITRGGCCQLTLDDDLASRQTRLGHMLYREALQQRSAGALVQALGMNASHILDPTTQRLIMDEDCVFLLCSDGLSDNGLVELYWEQEILPILEEQTDLNRVAQRLIHLANTLNGHDNVTVSLMKCEVEPSLQQPVALTFSEATEGPDDQEQQPTAFPLPVRKKQQGGASLLLLILALMMGGMSLAYWHLPAVGQAFDQFRRNVQQQLIEASP